MKINSRTDSNAVALDMRNFGYLPEDLAHEWMINLISIKKGSLSHPTKAIIELLNSCNLDCPMCRVGQYGINMERVLSVEDFSNIIDQIEGLETVRLNGLGESTLLPNFDDYLNLLFKKQIAVELISNGSGKLDYYNRILENNGTVIVSWDAAEKELFEVLRRPAIWEFYTQQLKSIANYSLSINTVKNVYLLFTLQKQNIDQLEKLVKRCVEWGLNNIIVNVVKLPSMNWIDVSLEKIEREFIKAYTLASDEGINLYLPNTINGKILDEVIGHKTCSSGCSMPWKEVVIRWNGDVQVCNMFNPYTYGNIFLNSFQTIWNNLFASLFRKMINTENKHSYCRDCVYFEEPYLR